MFNYIKTSDLIALEKELFEESKVENPKGTNPKGTDLFFDLFFGGNEN